MSRPPDDPRLARWRAETPGVERLTHLNNAGAALSPAPVRRAISDYLDLEVALGAYEAAESRAGHISGAKEAVGRCIGTKGRNIALTQNATTAFAQAMATLDFRPGDRIVTSRADYASNQIMYLALSRRLGVEVVRVPDAPSGGIDPGALEREVARRRPALVSVTWVPTNSGLVQPVEAIGKICREREIPYLVDGCQAVGQLPVDVERIGWAVGRRWRPGWRCCAPAVLRWMRWRRRCGPSRTTARSTRVAGRFSTRTATCRWTPA